MKDYSYTLTIRDHKDGIVRELNVVNKARGYGHSSFKTEAAAWKRLRQQIGFYEGFGDEVLNWTVTYQGKAIAQLYA